MTNDKYELGNTNIICQYHERHIENRIDFYQDNIKQVQNTFYPVLYAIDFGMP